MKSSQQLEREAEQTRRQLESTLDELRSRLTPGQVVDQIVDYAKDGKAGDFFSNLGRQTVNNPLPVALVGAGIAWLMFANGHGTAGARQASRSSRDAIGNGDHSPKIAAQHLGDVARSGSSAIGETIHDAADAIGDAVQDGKDKVGQTVTAVRDSVRNAATRAGNAASTRFSGASDQIGHSAERFRDSGAVLSRQASESAHNVIAFCKDQPLVLAGIGLALGAAIGAAIPPTRTENEFMGEASDDLKEKLVQVKEDATESASELVGAVTDHGNGDETRPEIQAQSSDAGDRMDSASAPARVS